MELNLDEEIFCLVDSIERKYHDKMESIYFLIKHLVIMKEIHQKNIEKPVFNRMDYSCEVQRVYSDLNNSENCNEIFCLLNKIGDFIEKSNEYNISKLKTKLNILFYIY